MKNVLLILIAVVITLGIQNFVLPKNQPGSAKTETAYDRVVRTNTLRCAYALYPPFLGKDPNTGKLNGIMADVMAEFEKASGLKIEWGPEIDWGNIAATLQSGKADAFCTTMLLTPKRGRVMAGSIPIFFTTVEAYARPDDLRFDNNSERLNQPDVRLSVNMGDLSEEVALRFFPQAQRVYKGELGGESALFLNVAANKADVTFSGPANLFAYNKNNPAMTLRQVKFQRPLMNFAGAMGVEIHETALLNVIDATLHDLIDNGIVDKILRVNLGADYNVAYFPPKPQAN
jgi:polar amino acid transport system substrate-binding protein